ncbi:MAG: hypothetical protein K9G58_04885 [Bacteroidales bacterium]|nr:hypothetical protein [Bacteroidales bacterium]MCF8388822.1 hypothetical protein [Bacteroidales bacterium]MCF8397481.1 hypothetical protein [Bacteroidales bacterium]
MEERNTKLETNKKNNNKLFPILLIIAAVIAVGLAVWLIFTKSDLNDLQAEKEKQRQMFIAELDSLMSEHNEIKEEYGELADTLHVKDSVIRANAKEIKNLLNYKWEYYKINKKFKKLQLVAQTYVHQMDSLYRENKALKEENVQIKRKYQKQVDITEELVDVQKRLSEKVEQAEILQTYNLKAEGIQLRWGGSKQKETDRARRVDKIRICFTLGENNIVPEGDKELYIRIARPDKLILTPSRGDDYSFMYQDEKLQYSIRKDIYYDGTSQDHCLYWSKKSEKEEMKEGTYYVEVFEGNNVIGATKFHLR